jgi:hypothetical protein
MTTHFHRRRASALGLLVSGAAVAACLHLSARAATAATFKVCVRVTVQTTDSGISVNGYTEDHYLGTEAPGGLTMIGRGFRVLMTQGGWEHAYDSATTDGCFSFSRTSSNGFGVRVYGFATDGEGNHVRIHTGGLSTSSSYPGQTYSAYWGNQTLGATNYYVLDGAVSDRWTTVGVAAFGLYRWTNGVNDATVSIGFSEGDCGDSGSTHGDAENYIESSNSHLMRVGRCAGSGTETRQKMLVTHELGHAMARLRYGYDGNDSPLNDDYNPPAGKPAECVNVGGYDMTSLEWNSLTFKEGFADFYSARVWNDASSRGSYSRFGTPVDLEVWDADFGENTPGGYAFNVCVSAADGVSTRQDYLRFFWDLHTAACASQPSQLDLLSLYRAVRENDRTGAFVLTDSNYDDAILYAVDHMGGLTACEIDITSTYLSHNHGG